MLSRKVTPITGCIDQYRTLQTDKQKSRYTGRTVETDIVVCFPIACVIKFLFYLKIFVR